MTGLDFLRGVNRPELVFGLVGALGSPMTTIAEHLKSKLTEVSYDTTEIHLSTFLSAYELPTPNPSESESHSIRYNKLMSRGNELREVIGRGDALAMHAAAYIQRQRQDTGSKALEGRAFILNQLKHPDEVKLLRRIYGDSFHLVGVYTPENVRSAYLRDHMGMTAPDATELIKRDSGEELDFGQHVAETFHLADLIVACTQGWKEDSINSAKQQLDRYIDLLFGRRIISPSVDEYGMFLASSAALRSADLSRQVGAAILTAAGEVISVGANEVPRAGGGQYWGTPDDDRDFVRGYDSNEKLKWECAKEVLHHIKGEEWKKLSLTEQEEVVSTFVREIAGTRLMNLTEFGRSVHAEMEAILSAARVGISVRNQLLYTTTFPCHNCAKHIVGAGLSRVVYVEPYSKSLADRLHGDAIAFSLDEVRKGKVLFEPFHGVTPRRFSELFSTVGKDGTRLRRKKSGGNVNKEPSGLRLGASPLTHVDREAMVALLLEDAMTKVSQPSKEGSK